MRPGAGAATTCGNARPRHRRANPRAQADRGVVAGTRRRRDRSRSGSGPRRPRDVCRTPGRRADAAPRVRSQRDRSRAGRRGCSDDRRFDPRDDAGGDGRRRPRRRRCRDRRPFRRHCEVRRAVCVAAERRSANLRARSVPDVRPGIAGDETGVEASIKVKSPKSEV